MCFTLKVDLFGLFHSFTYSSDEYLLSEQQVTFRGDQGKLDLKGEDPKEGIVRSKEKIHSRKRSRTLTHQACLSVAGVRYILANESKLTIHFQMQEIE